MSSGNVLVPSRPTYFVQTGGMHQNPYGVPREEIIRFILTNSSETVAQVVFGKYVESSGLVFKSDAVQRLFDIGSQPILGNFYRDQAAIEHARPIVERAMDWGSPYHTGIDFARQTDWTVITTIDTSVLPARLVYWKRLNRVPWEEIYREVGIVRELFGPNILCDSTGPGGDVVMDALESRRFCTEHQRTVLVGSTCQDDDGHSLGCGAEDYLALDCCEGYDFGGGTGEKKRRLVEHLRNCLEVGYRRDNDDFGWLRAPHISQLDEELTFYTWQDVKLQTDALFSLALAAWSGLEEQLPDPIVGSVYGG